MIKVRVVTVVALGTFAGFNSPTCSKTGPRHHDNFLQKRADRRLSNLTQRLIQLARRLQGAPDRSLIWPKVPTCKR